MKRKTYYFICRCCHRKKRQKPATQEAGVKPGVCRDCYNREADIQDRQERAA